MCFFDLLIKYTSRGGHILIKERAIGELGNCRVVGQQIIVKPTEMVGERNTCVRRNFKTSGSLQEKGWSLSWKAGKGTN